MDYTTIRVSTLRGDQKINFDAYLKIGEKMVLYVRQGDSFEGDRLKRLKEKKLKKMFILQDQEARYRDYMQKNIEMAYDAKSEKDLNTRAEIIQGQQQGNIEEVFDNPEVAEVYHEAKNLAGKYVQFLLSGTEAVGAVLNIENSDRSISHHGVAVATLAVSLATKLNIVDPKQTQLLALGALLHDFGHQDSPVNPAQDLKKLSQSDLITYRTHVAVGAQKVQDKKHFDEVVIKIIGQHEELVDGSGYPQKLKESQTDPLSVIVSTANAADRLISFEGVPRKEVAKKLMLERVGQHPLNQLQLMAEILKY